MEAGLEIAGRYRLEQLLGGGAFGEVWKAADLLRDRPVAMKFLHRGISATNPVVVAKFRQEAKIAVRLEHPGITRVDDFGIHDGQWFLVMEFLEGRDLAAELADHPQGLPVGRVVSLGVQLAEALATAHGMGVVHRDLKPANLIVTAEDRLKVCDFGIARMADASVASTVQTFHGSVGTPAYMAPEQWSGSSVDHRADLYALGGVLFHLLTGHPPFTSDRLEGLMGQHLNAKPPRVRAERPETPAALDKLITELLAKKPAQRPQHTLDVLERLRAIQRELTPPTVQTTAPPASDDAGRHTAAEPVPAAAPGTTGAPRPRAARPSKPGVSRRTLLTATATALGAAAVPFAVATALNGRKDPAGPAESAAPSPTGSTPTTQNTRTGTPVLTLTGHVAGVEFVTFSPDGSTIATASRDHTAKIWNAETGRLITTLEHEDYVNSVAFSPDGTAVVTAGDDGTAKVWKTETGKRIATLKHGGKVKSVFFSPDGAAVFTAAQDTNTAKKWNAKTGKLITTFIADYWVNFAALSPDGTALATVTRNGITEVWSTKTGKRVTSAINRGIWINSLAFSPDGIMVATTERLGYADVWNAKSGDHAAFLSHEESVNSAVFSSDSTMVVTASDDNTAKVWNARTGLPLLTLEHGSAVESAMFSPEGTVIATAGDDGTAKIWDAKTGEPIITLQHDAPVTSVAFSPDGSTIATASRDYTARTWRLEA
ncbi:serine/threonine-protein kinase [uncultured Thermomonospora sp.]|uniref:WD40 repeat domain-containing serine/threonine protein kinase n=1 Tax=uncultured Thermomonospora sp. TaxID=671175 RepID=UPI00259B95DF|nr:serine/threonine-protein kinase [uncultured Thermomonospora sp.]